MITSYSTISLFVNFKMKTHWILIFAYLCKICSSFELSIVHLNDVHSYFIESTPDNLMCSESDHVKNNCFGGLARQVTKIKEIRAREKNVLVLSSGDFYLADSYHPYHGWKLASVLLPYLNLNATGFGNHDFDRNMIETAAYVLMLKCPVVATNLIGRAGSFWEQYVNKSIILDVDGQKIGIVGYIDPDTKNTARTGVSLSFVDEIPSLKEEVQKLKDSGVNKIIALGHSDYHTDQEIAKTVPGIDIIVGGHSEVFRPNASGEESVIEGVTGPYPTVVTRLEKTVDSPADIALLVQVPQHGRYLGHLKVNFDDGGGIVNYSGSPIILSKNILPDREAEAAVNHNYAIKLNTSYWGHLPPYNEVLTQLTVGLNGTDCRMHECPLGNLLTDAMVHGYVNHEDDMKKRKIDGAVWNSGCIRSSLKSGNVTFLNLTFALYLGDTAVIQRLNGDELRKMMEHSVAKYDLSGIAPPGSFLQVSRIKVEYDLAKPAGQRVVSLSVFCDHCRNKTFLNVKQDWTYNIVMPQYLLQGGDGFFRPYGNRLNPNDITDGVALASFLRHAVPNHEVEGRIRFLLPNYKKSTNVSSLTNELYHQKLKNDAKNFPFFEFDKGSEESHEIFDAPIFNPDSHHNTAMMEEDTDNDTKANTSPSPGSNDSTQIILNASHENSQNLTTSEVNSNISVSRKDTIVATSPSASIKAKNLQGHSENTTKMSPTITALPQRQSSVPAIAKHPSEISARLVTQKSAATTISLTKQENKLLGTNAPRKTREDMNDKKLELDLIQIFEDDYDQAHNPSSKSSDSEPKTASTIQQLYSESTKDNVLTSSTELSHNKSSMSQSPETESKPESHSSSFDNNPPQSIIIKSLDNTSFVLDLKNISSIHFGNITLFHKKVNESRELVVNLKSSESESKSTSTKPRLLVQESPNVNSDSDLNRKPLVLNSEAFGSETEEHLEGSLGDSTAKTEHKSVVVDDNDTLSKIHNALHMNDSDTSKANAGNSSEASPQTLSNKREESDEEHLHQSLNETLKVNLTEQVSDDLHEVEIGSVTITVFHKTFKKDLSSKEFVQKTDVNSSSAHKVDGGEATSVSDASIKQNPSLFNKNQTVSTPNSALNSGGSNESTSFHNVPSTSTGDDQSKSTESSAADRGTQEKTEWYSSLGNLTSFWDFFRTLV